MSSTKQGKKIFITKDRPYLVSGRVPLSNQISGTNRKGESETWEQGQTYPEQEQYALCRCGHSRNKPFCDGSHVKVLFDGTETASRAPYQDQAQVLDGSSMRLADAETLCAFARFCDPNGQS